MLGRMHLKLERGILAIFSTVSTKFGTYSARGILRGLEPVIEKQTGDYVG
jgi:hypothetical protein